MENSWQVIRRYSDFDMLNNSLQISSLSLPLPPKKLIGNMDREFIAERQKGLQNYLNFITSNHILSNCEVVKKFLDPNNYSANYTEIALQQVSMFFRSDPRYEVVEPLKDIGWRLRKRNFLMRCKNQPKEHLVLSWADLGPDKYLQDKDFQCAIKLLPSLTHPYIYRVTFATASESSALVIRPFNDKGTLKDLIYKAKPKDPFLKKYCNPRKIQGLDLPQIKTFGRQILEVLKFLHDRGFPYGHLHASNVMLEGETCRLMDLENSLLGLPSYYRSYFSQFRKINTLESIDVHCFGHLLYEMTYGRPPDSIPVDQFPPAPSMSVGGPRIFTAGWWCRLIADLQGWVVVQADMVRSSGRGRPWVAEQAGGCGWWRLWLVKTLSGAQPEDLFHVGGPAESGGGQASCACGVSHMLQGGVLDS
ncbi:PX domain-containing protein kinase-like protein [Hyperolius riggenbachi]|uniref:PX domain-containing protein kinase-like protein n=1 Tax=Hyperolius riggenbachi TaxID=752182 RepID=UPI0035A266E7